MKVTVYLSTYNQEEYVGQALDSLLMQKPTFDFEIIAADDCSTDATQAVIMDYVNRYPEKIVPFFTDPNVGGCKKLTDVIDAGLFRGEYLAWLEGDDYWLGEDRLQTLVDFLESHPEYSRVSHQRRIVDENGSLIGMDVPEEILNKPFTIEDFLAGWDYSDFASVFRNYFLEAGNRYHSLLRSSRNVCDFQDMFITQDFGPVYVMDRCFAVYRYRSVAGASNYNSITTSRTRCIDHIRICRAVEDFYAGRYDLTPSIERYQQRLLHDALSNRSGELFEESRDYIPSATLTRLAAREMYLSLRGRRMEECRFLLAQLRDSERKGFLRAFLGCTAQRLAGKLRGSRPDSTRRGYLVRKQEAHR